MDIWAPSEHIYASMENFFTGGFVVPTSVTYQYYATFLNDGMSYLEFEWSCCTLSEIFSVSEELAFSNRLKGLELHRRGLRLVAKANFMESI